MDNLSCHACGMRFRSAAAEARHRHNFPTLCRKPKLSAAQSRALAKFEDNKIYSAFRAGESLPTLRALVRMGLLKDVTEPGPGGMAFPRTHFLFRKV